MEKGTEQNKRVYAVCVYSRARAFSCVPYSQKYKNFAVLQQNKYDDNASLEKRRQKSVRD